MGALGTHAVSGSGSGSGGSGSAVGSARKLVSAARRATESSRRQRDAVPAGGWELTMLEQDGLVLTATLAAPDDELKGTTIRRIVYGDAGEDAMSAEVTAAVADGALTIVVPPVAAPAAKGRGGGARAPQQTAAELDAAMDSYFAVTAPIAKADE